MSGKTLTPEQFKMAKAALGLSNPQLAEITGLHRNTLNKLDAGSGKESTWLLVRLALEQRGVVFIPENGGGAGVRLAKPGGQDL